MRLLDAGEAKHKECSQYGNALFPYWERFIPNMGMIYKTVIIK